ncbi:dimethyl sulfoxide reductase anchor subunit family protein [Cytobacillus sp. Hz8]|uniref:dimethyl sulfoxide reductase anchor subunit family protein n=1 Tax=Cytobacillus sp. Hz8 TaxID=3347168 RepID=UPI0035DFBDC9
MHEWALLIFTVCTQAAIGGIFMLALFYYKIAKLGQEQTFQAMKLPLIVIAVLSIIGLGASFAHLGAPSNAFNTLRHLGSSWMSREILVTGFFIAAACITAGLSLVQKKVNFWLLLLSTVIGAFDIYCMASIYSHSLINGWHSANTFTSFYGTAFVLGPVLAVSFIVPMLKADPNLGKNLTKYSFFIAIFGIAVQLVGVALFSAGSQDINMIAGTNAISSLHNYQGTIAIRWIIEVIGLGGLGFLSLADKKKISLSFIYVALAVLVLAEGMSRYLFYVLGA